MTTKNRNLGTILLLALAVLGLVLVSRACNNQTNGDQSGSSIESDQSLATSLPSTAEEVHASIADLPETWWIFEKFTGEKSTENGFEYSWATFVNGSMRIKAQCSSPNSPEPEVGAAYILDKHTNILYPVTDNSKGNLQRFWYPIVLQ